MFKLLSSNIMIYGTVNVVRALTPFLLLPILTQYLTQKEYGTLSIIEITITMLSPFILSGIVGGINTEYFHLTKKNLKLYISNSILLSFLFFIVISIIFLIFGKLLSDLFNIEESIFYLLPFFALIRIPISILLGILQVQQKPIYYGVIAISQSLLDLLLSYIFIVILNHGYIGRLEGTYGVYALFSMMGLVIIYRMDFLVLKVIHEYTKSILKFVLPLIPHAFSGTIIAYSDRYFIAYFQDTAAVGLYTVAYQLSAIIVLVAMSVNQAWTPMLLKLLKDNPKANLNAIFKVILVLISFYVFLFIFIFFNKDFLFNLLIDSKFFEAKQFFIYLLFGFLFQAIYMLFSTFFFFYKKTLYLAQISLVLGIVNLMLNYIFLQVYGIIGVAYATAITWFFFMILTIWNVKKLLETDLKNVELSYE